MVLQATSGSPWASQEAMDLMTPRHLLPGCPQTLQPWGGEGTQGTQRSTAPAQRAAVTQLQPCGDTDSVFPRQKRAPQKARDQDFYMKYLHLKMPAKLKLKIKITLGGLMNVWAESNLSVRACVLSASHYKFPQNWKVLTTQKNLVMFTRT